MGYADLLMDNGELVRIEYPDEHEDDFYDALENTLKRRDWWSTAILDGCNATYLGHYLDRVNMGRVIGML